MAAKASETGNQVLKISPIKFNDYTLQQSSLVFIERLDTLEKGKQLVDYRRNETYLTYGSLRLFETAPKFGSKRTKFCYQSRKFRMVKDLLKQHNYAYWRDTLLFLTAAVYLFRAIVNAAYKSRTLSFQIAYIRSFNKQFFFSFHKDI